MLKIFLSDDNSILVLSMVRERILEMRVHNKAIVPEDKKTWPREYRQLHLVIQAIYEAKRNQHWEKSDDLGPNSTSSKGIGVKGSRKAKA